ncbi:MAG: hypothetical protein II886_01075 [Prevotella sp.]|nr:hypothetical protein [Prevotella sp.]
MKHRILTMALSLGLTAFLSLPAVAADDVVIVKFDASKITGLAADNNQYPFAADEVFDDNRNDQVCIVKQADGSQVNGDFGNPIIRNRKDDAIVAGLTGLFQNGYHTADIAWQYRFSTIGFISATFQFGMAAKNAATKTWKAQWSTDGTTFTDLGENWTLTAETLKEVSLTLPDGAIGKANVYIRIMGVGKELTDLLGEYTEDPFTAGTSEGLSYCTNSESQVGNVTVLGTPEPDIELTVPAKGYATYVLDHRLRLHADNVEGVQLLTVTAVAGESVTTAEVAVAEAGQPLLVYNGTETAQTVKLVKAYTDADGPTTFSGFVGTLEDKEMDASSDTKDYYICNGKAFARVNDAGTVAANRCWLEIAKSAAAPQFIAVARNSITAVSPVTRTNAGATPADGAWYDLQGRRYEAGTAQKGIYIVDGKKVVMSSK